jgi:hypothetical protein
MKVQSMWIGDRLTLIEQLCIESFLQNGYAFNLYTYGNVRNVPSGTTVLDANEILPLEWKARFCDTGSHSVGAFSDVFRFKLLYDQGGIWVDMDVICLRRFIIKSDYCFPLTSGRMILFPDRGTAVDTWFLKAPKQSDLLHYCYETSLSHADSRITFGQIGPVLLTAAVEKYHLLEFARGPLFFPINWNMVKLFIDGSIISQFMWLLFSRYSVALHLYNSIWREKGINKDAKFPGRSILERLKERYLAASTE